MNATTRVYSYNGWQALAQAIIKQTVEDWRVAQKRMKRPHTDTRGNLAMIDECERFLKGPTPNFLCDINGQYILRKLKEELKSA